MRINFYRSAIISWLPFNFIARSMTWIMDDFLMRKRKIIWNFSSCYPTLNDYGWRCRADNLKSLNINLLDFLLFCCFLLLLYLRDFFQFPSFQLHFQQRRPTAIIYVIIKSIQRFSDICLSTFAYFSFNFVRALSSVFISLCRIHHNWNRIHSAVVTTSNV